MWCKCFISVNISRSFIYIGRMKSLLGISFYWNFINQLILFENTLSTIENECLQLTYWRSWNWITWIGGNLFKQTPYSEQFGTQTQKQIAGVFHSNQMLELVQFEPFWSTNSSWLEVEAQLKIRNRLVCICVCDAIWYFLLRMTKRWTSRRMSSNAKPLFVFSSWISMKKNLIDF